MDPFSIDMGSVAQVIGALEAGAAACAGAACREGSIERIECPCELIATGDMHDNPFHFRRACEWAGMVEREDGMREPLRHLTLQELIHGEHLRDGMDFSYRVLARAAALKAAHPEHVHVLLANHELAQMAGHAVAKGGVKCVEAFDEAVEYVFGEEAGAVREAINGFLRALPLGLRVSGWEKSVEAGAEVGTRADAGMSDGSGDLLCTHSLPDPALVERFDAGVFARALTAEDYAPRQGSAHLLVWGRGHNAGDVEALGEHWGVSAFILGHETAPEGVARIGPGAVIVNSDHERAAALLVRCEKNARASLARARVLSLHDSV